MLIYIEMLSNDSDKSKIEQIYMKYKNLMFYAANKILNNTQDAEDAVHQAFLSIVDHVEKISEPICTKTQAFVVTIVERKAIDIYRKKTKASILPLDAIETGLLTDTEMGNPLASAIAKLPVKQRQLIQLKYYFGYTNRELADILGLSYEGVHSLDQRAKKQLRDLLEKEGMTF